MKICSRCKKEKDYDEFYKDKAAKDGYNCICKLCRLEMDRNRRKSDPEWVKRRKIHNSLFHKNNREKVRERKKRWFSSQEGLESHRNSTRKYREKNPEKKKAQDAVYRAVRRGELIIPEHCQICNRKGQVEAHHAQYGKEKRTSVIWICKRCHEKISRKMFI